MEADINSRTAALTDCTVQFAGMLPTPAVEATAVPFMNHVAVLPLVSAERKHGKSVRLRPA
jgi:hypothetical protein